MKSETTGYLVVAVACHIAGVLPARELKSKVKFMQRLTEVLSSREKTVEELSDTLSVKYKRSKRFSDKIKSLAKIILPLTN
jgi:hypothetical protein